MKISNIKQFLQTPFSVEVSTVQNSPGTWNSTKVSIFRDDKLIGEYLRNYHGSGIETFYPFEMNNEWYALYSANYTATRVLKLHEDRIEDWCGEEASSFGFCPIEFYIPRYNMYSVKDKYDYYDVDAEYKTQEEFVETQTSADFVETKFCNFGFMSGCIWGDDSSWKLRYIDLEKIPEKELSIIEKFGYWELPHNMSLKECIDMSGWEPDHDWVRLVKSECINVKTGEHS